MKGEIRVIEKEKGRGKEREEGIGEKKKN